MIFEDGFIKLDKIDILSENHRDTDLFDWGCYVDKFTDKIKLFKKNTIMGFIGDFGNGKSTFLNQVIKKVDKDIKWIEFNARKYPDRKDLWENFILECAISINKSEFYEVLSKIDGTKGGDKKKLIELGSEFLSTITNIKAFDHIKHFGHFFNDTPVKRVFQLELTLKEILSKIEEPIINIIIEDIDRSGDSGIYFLETLHYFINENEIAAKLINIIVPIGSTKYRENLDHYGKCLDIVHDFKTNFLKFDGFIKELFDDSIINDNRLFSQLCSFFEEIFKKYSHCITIRKFKKAILAANNLYILLPKDDGKMIDFRICILLELSKYIFEEGVKGSIYENIIKDKVIGDSVLKALIYCIYEENTNTYRDSVIVDRGDGFGNTWKSLYDLNLIIEVKNRIWSQGNQNNYTLRLVDAKHNLGDNPIHKCIEIPDIYLS